MVTLAYVLVLLSISLLMTLLNMYTYSQTFIESLLFLLWFELGSRRIIVVIAAFIGLCAAIAHDWQQKANKTQEHNERQ